MTEEMVEVVVERKNNVENGKKNYWFFAHFALFSLSPQCSKSTYIYKGWKRDILFLVGITLDPWFNRERSQSLAQNHHHELLKFGCWKLIGLAFLGRRGDCRGNQPARITLGCWTMSGHYSGVWFVWFGGETRH